jgi:hypothetical protein
MAFFNHQKAAAYARQWAKGTNPDYPQFSEDCTGFASQAMLAGGWTMVGGDMFLNNYVDRMNDDVWWYAGNFVNWASSTWLHQDLYRASYTWSAADYFARWLVVSKRAVRVKDPMDLQPGDIIQERVTKTGVIGHSMVITGKTRTDLKLSYHSLPRLDNSFNGIVANSSGVEFIPWRILTNFPALPPVAVPTRPTPVPVPTPIPRRRH